MIARARLTCLALAATLAAGYEQRIVEAPASISVLDRAHDRAERRRQALGQLGASLGQRQRMAWPGHQSHAQ